MKNLTQNLLGFLIALTCILHPSCKKEELPTKDITYILSGNFGKNILVKYTPTAGTMAIAEELVTLPWQKDVTPNAENASVGLIVTGKDGTPSAEITAKIFVNGVEEHAVIIKADEKGNLALNINHLFD